MKRLHIHVSVKDLSEGVRFYSDLFAVPPTIRKDDYAKWMMDDPCVNFAVSTRTEILGINHLGMQVDSAGELAEMEQRLAGVGLNGRSEPDANCCYARSDKHWLEDPQGVVWEVFHTLGVIPVHGTGRSIKSAGQDVCCTRTPGDSE